MSSRAPLMQSAFKGLGGVGAMEMLFSACIGLQWFGGPGSKANFQHYYSRLKKEGRLREGLPELP